MPANPNPADSVRDNDSSGVSGSCLCGKVALSITEFDRDIVACHCQQCRKQTGTYVSAASVSNDNLAISGAEHVQWFAASGFAKRGFCKHCGSLLFWKRNDAPNTSVMAGCLDSPTGLSLTSHIYVADKGDYYTIEDGLPQHAQSD